MYPPTKPFIPYQHTISRTVPDHTPNCTNYHTTYHTIPKLYLHHPRRSTIRGHDKSMPNIKENIVEPRGSTIRAQLCGSIYSRSSHNSAAGAHIYSTGIQSNPPTQPSTTRFSVDILHSQPSPCNSSNAGGVENSRQVAHAEQESSHATSVSGLWDRRVHRVGRHHVNAYHPLVGLEFGGRLNYALCVGLCSVVFVVLRVLDT